MGKVTGFMEFERLEQAHEPVAQRKTHFREFITPLSQQEAKPVSYTHLTLPTT